MLGLLLMAMSPPPSGGNPCAGTYLLCDDFNGSSIDTDTWTVGNVNIAQKYPVRPENISVTTYNDKGTIISVVDSKAYGALHTAAPKQGGVTVSKDQLAGGRYEVRMKNLPGPNGCSCIWNYYDSLNEATCLRHMFTPKLISKCPRIQTRLQRGLPGKRY